MDTIDPYEPDVERKFKGQALRMSSDDVTLHETVEYWLRYLDLYGTPEGLNARSLGKAFKRLAAYADVEGI